jgi:hypothetical protein
MSAPVIGLATPLLIRTILPKHFLPMKAQLLEQGIENPSLVTVNSADLQTIPVVL